MVSASNMPLLIHILTVLAFTLSRCATGKCPETWAAFALKGKHLPRIMGTGRKMPEQTAPHLVYFSWVL